MARNFGQRRDAVSPELDKLTESIIGACIEVHRELGGPGLTEKLYEEALCHELDLRGIAYRRQVTVPVVYKRKPIGETRVDLVIAGRVILELKACEELNQTHKAQLGCYLTLLKLKVGLLINFNTAILADGIRRIVRSNIQ